MLAGNGNVRKIGSFVFSSSTETGVFAIAVSCKASRDIILLYSGDDVHWIYYMYTYTDYLCVYTDIAAKRRSTTSSSSSSTPQVGSGYVVATPVAKFIEDEEELSYFAAWQL